MKKEIVKKTKGVVNPPAGGASKVFEYVVIGCNLNFYSFESFLTHLLSLQIAVTFVLRHVFHLQTLSLSKRVLVSSAGTASQSQLL